MEIGAIGIGRAIQLGAWDYRYACSANGVTPDSTVSSYFCSG